MGMNIKRKSLCLSLMLSACGWFSCAGAVAAQQPLISFASAPVQVAFPSKDSILTFLYAGSGKTRHIEIHVLIPDRNEFSTRYVGTIESKGTAPVIESTFLFNVDSDPEHELFVLARWDPSGPAGKGRAAQYKTYVFDQPAAQSQTGSIRLREVEDKIDSASNGRQDVDTVRELLNTLGY